MFSEAWKTKRKRYEMLVVVERHKKIRQKKNGVKRLWNWW